MAAVNVLVYNGPGTAVSSTERTLSVLRMLLKGRYDVLAAGADVLTHADRAWHASTALLVVPGGRDVPYVESLGTRGSTAIADYVRGGGSYLGICAGAYFASSALEFEKGTALEVAGKRSLALANVVARGSASPGFVYDSEEGAATIHIDVNLDILGPLPNASRPYRVASYCNGAPYFDLIDPASVQVLAKYDSLEVIPAAREKAAIIQTNFGKGHVILMGPHLEHENTLPGGIIF
ncbi:biotin-protein ligase [Chytriomyces sp. MP71]|nr:biotin-protein ligase [Chytriomyces sp. MP71]